MVRRKVREKLSVIFLFSVISHDAVLCDVSICDFFSPYCKNCLTIRNATGNFTYVLIDALHLDHADMEVFNAKLQVSFAPSNYLFIRTLSLEPAWAVERVKLFYQEPRISPVGFALLLSMFSADGAQTLESPAFIISICVCS